MNIAQMIQEGGPAVAAAVAALVDPAIQPDALHLAAVGLARQQADEIERLTAERDKAHQDGIRAACERDAMRSERDSLLEQLAAAQREVVDRLAEAAALRAQKPVARAEQVGEQVVARWLTSDHAMVCPAGTPLYAAPATAGPTGWAHESGCPQWAHGQNIPLYLTGQAGKLFLAVGAYWVDGVLSVATESKDDGWKLVPVEPTTQMHTAGYATACSHAYVSAWKAMLAAAQKGGE